MAAPSECVPGQRICKFEEGYTAGNGTYIRNGYVHATLAGYVQINSLDDGKTSIDVRTKKEKNIVPSVGSVVSVRINNVNPRFCKCAILSVENTTMQHSFRGMIRKEDVRATEKDRIEMYKCFRPGDIVLARVLSLGDAQSYVLSTAENELGVVTASSEAGVEMVPINWCEMQCPITLVRENRKVAKVDIASNQKT